MSLLCECSLERALQDGLGRGQAPGSAPHPTPPWVPAAEWGHQARVQAGATFSWLARQVTPWLPMSQQVPGKGWLRLTSLVTVRRLQGLPRPFLNPRGARPPPPNPWSMSSELASSPAQYGLDEVRWSDDGAPDQGKAKG